VKVVTPRKSSRRAISSAEISAGLLSAAVSSAAPRHGFFNYGKSDYHEEVTRKTAAFIFSVLGE